MIGRSSVLEKSHGRCIPPFRRKCDWLCRRGDEDCFCRLLHGSRRFPVTRLRWLAREPDRDQDNEESPSFPSSFSLHPSSCASCFLNRILRSKCACAI